VARVLGAARLSRATDESTSVEGQSAAITTWSESRGHELVTITVDTDVSGSVTPFKRSGIGPWLTAAKADEWDILAVHKVDRLGRSVLHQAQVKDWCKEHGKELVFVDGAADLSTRGGKLTANVLAVVGEDELEAIRDRTRGSRMRLRQAARYPGGPIPYGYRKQQASKSDGWQLVPDPATSAVIQGAAEKIIAGSSMSAVVRDLNKRGIPSPTGKTWRTQSLSFILHSRALLGHVLMNGQPVRDADGLPVMREPILTPAMFAELQDALDAGSRPHSGRRFGASLLLRVAYCENCGSVMYRQVRANRNAAYYHCQKAIRHLGCQQRKAIRADKLEQVVSDELLEAVGPDTPMRERKVFAAISHSSEIDRLTSPDQ